MADLGDFSSQPESSSFDNGFEKLDPLAPGSDDQLVSSTQRDTPEADLYSASSPLGGSGEAEPLVDLGEPLVPAAAAADPPAPFQPDSSEPAPAAPAPSKDKKASSSSG